MAVSPPRSAAVNAPYRWSFRTGEDAPRLARQAVDHDLGRVTARHERRVLRQLVSELVTNAVVHGPRRGAVGLRVAITTGGIRVEVDDDGAVFRPLMPPPARPDGSSAYGLTLVDHTAARWGIEDRPGTRVWFELDR
jgi:anti-sigma regulatory factor (Ser/Thr protein kinase)